MGVREGYREKQPQRCQVVVHDMYAALSGGFGAGLRLIIPFDWS